MRKPSLAISTFTGPCSLWLYIDNQLILKNTDIATIELDSSGEYILFWYVKGPPGSTYSITISSPREAEYQLTKTITASGKDQDSFRFEVNGVSGLAETNPILA